MKDVYYLSAEKLSVGYDGVPLIENVELSVRRGEILTLIGPNGSGKSTILKSLIRQLRLIAGTVVLDGRSLSDFSDKELARTMAILMTERLRSEYLSCWDVAATGRYPYTGRLGLLSGADRELVDSAIRMVHAEDVAARDFSRVSDGQRQRVLLARAICQEPEVVVLDEPTSFLDVKHKLELLDILKSLVRERNVAVVMSLHELDLAEKVSDRVLCVGLNGIDRCDTPEKVFTDAYIRSLYGMEKGSFNSLFGCVELERVSGAPEVFVIGGGGRGIPVYRFLQRHGVPFAAGVLPESDLDYPVARELAAVLVSEPPFAAVRAESVDRALDLLRACRRAVCCVERFGESNAENQRLRDAAANAGKLIEWDALHRELEGARE